MSQKDFSDRIARLGTQTATEHSYASAAKPIKKHWARWVVAVCALAVLGFMLLQFAQPKPTFDDVFSDSSVVAFEGDLETVTFRGYGFQIDIPSNWREMTSDEKSSYGGDAHFTEEDTTTLADLAAAGKGEGSNIYVTIGSYHADGVDALTYLKTVNGYFGLINIIGWFTDASFSVLKDPAIIESFEPQAAETVVLAKSAGLEFGMVHRVYEVGENLIEIVIFWEDTKVHPTTFATFLDSLRIL
jgi:hypothetical protein